MNYTSCYYNATNIAPNFHLNRTDTPYYFVGVLNDFF